MTRSKTLEDFLARMPFAKTLGIECEIRGDEMTAILPFRDHLIGNPMIPALHGGAIGSFLEICAMAQVYLMSETPELPRPINLTIDYLRPGKTEDAFARCQINRISRRVASVQAEAWQARRDEPIARLQTHFLLAILDA